MLSHKAGQTTAALWFNPTETFVDVWRREGSTHAYFMSAPG